MKPDYVRLGIAVVLLGFLIIFFVPLIYSTNLSGCHMAGWYGIGGQCAMGPAGLKSIGVVLFDSGAIYEYGFGGGYSLNWGVESLLLTFGVLIGVVLPLTVISATLLSPDQVEQSDSSIELAFRQRL